MTTSINRRNLVKQGAAVVIGAGLAGGTVETDAAGQQSREAFERVLAWEDALAAAGTRGESWVKQAWILRSFVQGAVWQAEETGEPALLASLRTALAEADGLHAQRSATFQRWANEAWGLPDLAPLPPMPWR
ncbi:MAG: hypothetical protein M3R02_01245 [Chloroflexota bacterium]|nr:hypothetical protein [Chloroflexota bacterium]